MNQQGRCFLDGSGKDWRNHGDRWKAEVVFFVALGVVRKWGTYPKMAALLWWYQFFGQTHKGLGLRKQAILRHSEMFLSLKCWAWKPVHQSCKTRRWRSRLALRAHTGRLLCSWLSASGAGRPTQMRWNSAKSWATGSRRGMSLSRFGSLILGFPSFKIHGCLRPLYI